MNRMRVEWGAANKWNVISAIRAFNVINSFATTNLRMLNAFSIYRCVGPRCQRAKSFTITFAFHAIVGIGPRRWRQHLAFMCLEVWMMFAFILKGSFYLAPHPLKSTYKNNLITIHCFLHASQERGVNSVRSRISLTWVVCVCCYL